MAIRFSHDNSQHHNFDNTWLDSSVHFMYFAIHPFNACPNWNVALGSPGVESGFGHDVDVFFVFFFFFTTDNKIGPNRSILKRNLQPILKQFGILVILKLNGDWTNYILCTTDYTILTAAMPWSTRVLHSFQLWMDIFKRFFPCRFFAGFYIVSNWNSILKQYMYLIVSFI